MTSNNARLARLEKQARESHKPSAGIDAVENGTATLDDYASALAAPLAKLKEDIFAESVGLVAIVHSRFRYPRRPQNAVAFPPDQPLPDYHRDAVRYHEERSKAPVETTDLEAHKKRGGFGVLNPFTRAEHAITHLALGGHDAHGLREAVWIRRDGLWEVSPDAWAAGERRTVSLHALHYWHGVEGLYRAWTEGKVGDPNDRYAHVSVADIARFIGLPRIEALAT